MRESYSRTFFRNEAVSRDSTANPERFTSQRFFIRLRSLASWLCAVRSVLPNLAAHGKKNVPCTVRVRSRRLSHCAGPGNLHRCRSGKARRRNCNRDRQSGRLSSIRQRQHFLEHGRQIPESSLHGLDTFGERGAVLESAAIRGQNRGCVWKDYAVSGETGNHCHKRLANYHQVMRLIPHEPYNETMKPTAPSRDKFSVFATTPSRGLS